MLVRFERGNEMRLDRLTIKSQEALQAAQETATGKGHQAIEPEHLLLALVRQQDGVVLPLLQKLSMNLDMVAKVAEAEINRLPCVEGTGAQSYISPRLKEVLDHSWKEAQRLKDEYVSTEHLFIALVEDQRGVLKNMGLKKDEIYKALADVRGNHRVTDPNPEDKYQALKRFCKDLTELAREHPLPAKSIE